MDKRESIQSPNSIKAQPIEIPASTSNCWYEGNDTGEAIPVKNFQDYLKEEDQEKLEEIKVNNQTLVRSNLSAQNALKEYKIAYHNGIHCYVKLEKHVTEPKPNEQAEKFEPYWQCLKIKSKADEAKKVPDERFNAQGKDLSMYLRLRVTAQINGKSVFSGVAKISIADKIGDLVRCQLQIYQAGGIAVLRGEMIEPGKTFEELQILETDTVFIFGNSSIQTKSYALKTFKRFLNHRDGDTWHVGPNSCDALVWIPNKPIRVFGIMLYEKYPLGG